LQRTVYPPIGSTFDASATYALDEMGLGWNNLPFDIPNHRAENGPADFHVRIDGCAAWRTIYHAFAIAPLPTSLQKSANKDSVQYLLDLIGPARIVPLEYKEEDADEKQRYPLDTARFAPRGRDRCGEIRLGKRSTALGKDTAWGSPLTDFLTYVATWLKSKSTARDGAYSECLDRARCGTVVSPTMSETSLRERPYSEPAWRCSARLPRLMEPSTRQLQQLPASAHEPAPRHVDVQIVKSEEPPAGVGEPGVPPFRARRCNNAVFALLASGCGSFPLSKTKLVVS